MIEKKEVTVQVLRTVICLAPFLESFSKFLAPPFFIVLSNLIPNIVREISIKMVISLKDAN